MHFFLSFLMAIANELSYAAGIQYESVAHTTGSETVGSRKQYPFFVQIYVYYENSDSKVSETRCGGSILSSSYVITAAHCFHDNSNDPSDQHWRDPEGIIIYSGEITKDRRDWHISQGHRVKNIQKLNNFWRPKEEGAGGLATGGYDVAVLELKDLIEFDAYRQPLTPCRGEYGAKNPSDWNLMSVGFGVTNTNNEITDTDTLMQVDLEEIGPEHCQKLFAGSSHPEGSLVCHNYQDKDICYVDAGSPLFLVGDQDESVCLYGVSSYGKFDREDPSDDCGYSESPSVAARVSYYLRKFNLTGFPTEEDESYPDSIEVGTATTAPIQSVSVTNWGGDKSIKSAADCRQTNSLLLSLFVPLMYIFIVR